MEIPCKLKIRLKQAIKSILFCLLFYANVGVVTNMYCKFFWMSKPQVNPFGYTGIRAYL
jgi:hypothetical protein